MAELKDWPELSDMTKEDLLVLIQQIRDELLFAEPANQ